MQYLDLADYLLISEVVLGVPAEEIGRWPGIGLADSALHAPMAAFENVELYPDAIDKAAVLCVRLARNRSLPDGNQTRRILAMLEFLVRKQIEWTPPSVDETVAVIESVAAGTTWRAISLGGFGRHCAKPSAQPRPNTGVA